MDVSVAASKSTTLESSSTLGIQTTEEAGGALVGGVTTEDILKEGDDVVGSITEKLSDEPECPAFGGNVCGISESGACQTGKHNEGRTHVQRVCIAQRL